MKAAVLEGVNNIIVKNVPTPEPERNEALVRIKACGICQTDYSAFTGARTNWAPPLILGHEMSGIIEEAGKDIKNFKVGDEVIISPVAFCGKCRNCRLGFQHYCEQGIVFGGDGQDIVKNGGFAEYIVVPETTLYHKPENISFVAAAITEPLAGSYKGLIEYTNLRISEDIVIIGIGSMGMLVTMIALKAGAGNIIVVDLSDYTLNFAKELGVKYVINPLKSDAKKRIYEILPDGPDIVFESAGSLEAASLAFSLVRRGTRINMFGVIIPGNIEVSPARIHFLETRVDASFSVTPRFMTKSIDLMKKGLINPESIVTHKFRLDDINAAMDMMDKKDRIKVIIEP